MADVAEIQYFDVESYIHGSDTYKGITGVRIRKYIGTLTPVRKEGELYASGVERSGADQFPVEIDVESNSMETLFSLVDAAGRDDLLLPDGVHFKPEGYALLGKAVADCIRSVLTDSH